MKHYISDSGSIHSSRTAARKESRAAHNRRAAALRKAEPPQHHYVNRSGHARLAAGKNHTHPPGPRRCPKCGV